MAKSLTTTTLVNRMAQMQQDKQRAIASLSPIEKHVVVTVLSILTEACVNTAVEILASDFDVHNASTPARKRKRKKP